MLKFPKHKKIRDKKWMVAVRSLNCVICGINDGTVCGHHLKHLTDGSMGSKPSDDYVVPTCSAHHTGITIRDNVVPKPFDIHGIEKRILWDTKLLGDDPRVFAKTIYKAYKDTQ